MKRLASRDNPDYRRLLRAAAGKRAPGERREQGKEIVLEGVHLCEGWLARKGDPRLAFFDETRIDRPELARLLSAVAPEKLRLCSPGLLQGGSDVVTGQGVIFLAEAPTVLVPSVIDENCLWLDRIQDPGNMGTLLRTAAAAGLGSVFLSTGCVAAWSPKVLRSAQGAHFALRIHENVDLMLMRERLQVPLLATALDDAQSLYEADLPHAAAWVFGNEGQGVRRDLLVAADMRVFIPQSPNVESLNVGVAAGICLFEQRRQVCRLPPQ